MRKRPWVAKTFWFDGRRLRMILVNPPVESFAEAPEDGFWDTADLARLKGCHIRTVQRHVEIGLLKPHTIRGFSKDQKIGGEFWFTKKEARRWAKAVDVKIGRPRKKELKNDAHEKRTTPGK